MLLSVSIRDVVLIDRLDVTFEGGLSVLTGETGAGKSILVDSLELLLGGRGRPELVRTGAAQAEVEALFVVAARVAGDPEPDLRLELPALRRRILAAMPPPGAIRNAARWPTRCVSISSTGCS